MAEMITLEKARQHLQGNPAGEYLLALYDQLFREWWKDAARLNWYRTNRESDGETYRSGSCG